METTLRRSNRAPENPPMVMLTSMIDMFTILLVFLLKSYSAIDVQASPELILPVSTAEQSPENAIKVTITQTQILVEDKAVAPVTKGNVHPALKRRLLIVPLFDALKEHADRRAMLAESNPEIAKRLVERIVIVGDESTPAALLDEIFYTISQRGFEKFHLIVTKKVDSSA